MNILYISTAFPKPEDGATIYTDLAEGLSDNNHKVIVVVAEGKSTLPKTSFAEERNIRVLRVKTLDYYNVGLLRKGLASLTMARTVKKAIIKHLSAYRFDAILFEAPPVTMYSVVKWAMKHYGCPSYLMQKDIFPQNAVDIGIIRKNSMVYKYFRYQEKQLLMTATHIGCMSQGNIDYILNHNSYLTADKVELFPNTKKIHIVKKERTGAIRERLAISPNTTLAVFGGNMGKPQAVDVILKLAEKCKDREDVFFLLIGRGTERDAIQRCIEEKNLSNIKLINSLPRDEYEDVLVECDIGMIFLDSRFTIPNFPSRVLSYFEYSIPVLAATDENTDFGQMILAANAGLWSDSANLDKIYQNLDRLVKDSAMRKLMGKNGRLFLEQHYTVDKSIKILEEHFS